MQWGDVLQITCISVDFKLFLSSTSPLGDRPSGECYITSTASPSSDFFHAKVITAIHHLPYITKTGFVARPQRWKTVASLRMALRPAGASSADMLRLIITGLRTLLLLLSLWELALSNFFLLSPHIVSGPVSVGVEMKEACGTNERGPQIRQHAIILLPSLMSDFAIIHEEP